MERDCLRRIVAHSLFILVSVSALFAAPARAVDPADLLPVDEAFALTATAPSRDRIELDWKIADGYYLYRHRTAVAPAGGGFVADALRMPEGERHVDQFFGEVETYRGNLHAVLPGIADAGVQAVTLEVKYQGCADSGVCYPPQKRMVTVALPPAAGAGPGLQGIGGTGGGLKLPGIGATDAPLPEAQAYGFEAIVGDAGTLLLRFTPADGYYLYRDRSEFRVEGGEGIAAGMPRWPEGTRYHDEYFGDQVVYFDQVDVPLPIRRDRGDATDIRVVATFQGCQTGGICYPPMTRTVSLHLPRASADELALAAAADAGGNRDQGDDAAARPAGPDTAGLLLALLLALAGGVILNLMPCVLPVLALKALSLADSGARARSHALWYTAGVLASFLAVGALVLALRATGQALGWGLREPGNRWLRGRDRWATS